LKNGIKILSRVEISDPQTLLPSSLKAAISGDTGHGARYEVYIQMHGKNGSNRDGVDCMD